GSLLTQAMRALDQLEQTGQSIDVIHPSCLNHIDLDPIVRSLQKTGGKLIVMEDHQQIAGFGQHLVGEITKSAPGLITEYKSLAVAG
ncbi:transketolase C-terminal domain-containing protein, partial [Streptococcus pyogenes]